MEKSKNSLPSQVSDKVFSADGFNIVDTLAVFDRAETWKNVFEAKDSNGASYTALHNPAKGIFYTNGNTKYLYDIDGEPRGVKNNKGDYEFNLPKDEEIEGKGVGTLINPYVTKDDPALGKYFNLPFNAI